MLKKTVISLIILSILAGCKSAPRFQEPVTRYFIFFFEDEQGEVVPECYAQEYSLNDIKKLSELRLVNLLNCDELGGFPATLWKDVITPKGREIKNWAIDTCD